MAERGGAPESSGYLVSRAKPTSSRWSATPPFAICVADGFELGWLDDAAENDPIALCFSSEFFENERTDGNAVDE